MSICLHSIDAKRNIWRYFARLYNFEHFYLVGLLSVQCFLSFSRDFACYRLKFRSQNAKSLGLKHVRIMLELGISLRNKHRWAFSKHFEMLRDRRKKRNKHTHKQTTVSSSDFLTAKQWMYASNVVVVNNTQWKCMCCVHLWMDSVKATPKNFKQTECIYLWTKASKHFHLARLN